MKLNRVEQALMNNPVRAAVQRHVDAALFERLGGKLDGLRVLEVGCGRGVGVEILLDRFGARDVHAFDLDPLMVHMARRRLVEKYPRDRVWLAAGDVAAIPYPDAAFDAVVDFGAIHHVPDWRVAIEEVRRVLRSAGRFYFFEVTKECLELWVVRALLSHPRENRFGAEEFIGELEDRGLVVRDDFVRRWLGYVVIGVARVEEPPVADGTDGRSGPPPPPTG